MAQTKTFKRFLCSKIMRIPLVFGLLIFLKPTHSFAQEVNCDPIKFLASQLEMTESNNTSAMKNVHTTIIKLYYVDSLLPLSLESSSEEDLKKWQDRLKNIRTYYGSVYSYLSNFQPSIQELNKKFGKMADELCGEGTK